MHKIHLTPKMGFSWAYFHLQQLVSVANKQDIFSRGCISACRQMAMKENTDFPLSWEVPACPVRILDSSCNSQVPKELMVSRGSLYCNVSFVDYFLKTVVLTAQWCWLSWEDAPKGIVL